MRVIHDAACKKRKVEPHRECYKGDAPPAMRFVCPGCGRLCAPCYGASDDMPDHCTRCWQQCHVKIA